MESRPLKESSRWLLAAMTLLLGGGCKDTPAPAPASTGAPGPPSSASDSPAAVGRPVIAGQDDPLAPACLPRAGMAGRWIPSEPIRVYSRERVGEALARDRAETWASFNLIRVATAAYVQTLPTGEELRARVVLAETASAEDAYGLLSCEATPAELFKIGGETRVRRGDGLDLHCWHGRSYVHVSVNSTGAESTEEAIRLLMPVAGRIGREDRPVILDAMPRDPLLEESLWLVRRVAGLPAEALAGASPLEIARVEAVLGLGEEGLLCVGRYESTASLGPNVVWLARYPTSKAAREAHARYQAYLKQARSASAGSTNLLPPHGTYLIGTWTAEEESLQYLLPRIKKLLPT